MRIFMDNEEFCRFSTRQIYGIFNEFWIEGYNFSKF